MGSSQSTTHDIPKSTYKQTRRYESQQRTKATTHVATQYTSQDTITKTQPSKLKSTQRQDSIEEKLKLPDINKESTSRFQNNVTLQNGYQVGKNQLYDSTTKTDNLARNQELLKNHKDHCTKDKVTITPIYTTSNNYNLKSITKPPKKLNDLDDFIKNWNTWQDQFTSFLVLSDEKKQKYHEWGSFFLYFMGPVGQQILNSLYFDKEDDKKDYVILMRKYNAFYEFYTTTKFEGESITDYIERLKTKTALNIRNVDETLKKKISQDIQKHHKERFTALARSKLPYFKFETMFNSLTLAEINFLWKACEESNFLSNKNCICCGRFHQERQCPALGKECNKCKKRNHFAKCCPGFRYINNCNFCGGNHDYKQCLAYGETCSKCGKTNHFSWKCSKEILLQNCLFCGLSHLRDKSKCPAKNSLCCICCKRGHYEVKCKELNNLA